MIKIQSSVVVHEKGMGDCITCGKQIELGAPAYFTEDIEAMVDESFCTHKCLLKWAEVL